MDKNKGALDTDAARDETAGFVAAGRDGDAAGRPTAKGEPTVDATQHDVAAGDSDADGTQGAGRAPGRIVTVFSAKGGTGKTTISTNLAVALNAAGSRRVCLVDLDLEFGDIAITLSLTPSHTILDALDVDLTDDDTIAGLVTSFGPNLDCVLAPVSPGDADRIRASHVADLLASLRSRYDYVVVDTPSQFSEQVLEALDLSDHQILVTTPEITSLKNLRLTLDMLDLLGYSESSRAIVFNRADDKVGLSALDVEAAVKATITARIPVSQDVPASINRGVPLAVSNAQHPVPVAIRQLAQTAITGTETSGRRSSRFGLKLRKRTK